jgi:hypothetical protein
MLAPPETAGRGEDTKNRCHSVDTKLLHPQFNSSGPMVAAKRQISWGCVATSNDDLSAITATTSNGLSPPTNSSLPLIVSTTEYIFLLEMKQGQCTLLLKLLTPSHSSMLDHGHVHEYDRINFSMASHVLNESQE